MAKHGRGIPFQKGHVPWMKGRHQSRETIEKIRSSRAGWVSPFRGVTGRYTDETRKRISDTLKKNPVRYWKGKKLSNEHKSKLSKAHLGLPSKKKGKKFPEFSGNKHPRWKGGMGWVERSRIRREKMAGRKMSETCELCGAMGIIHFDHDHFTGKFRGWLCRRCNLTLGFVKDSVDLLNKMIEYLNKSK